MSTRKLRRWTAVLFFVLLINTAYIAAFNSPTIFYMGSVLLHLVLGVVRTVALLFLLRQIPAAAGFFLAAALGVFLAAHGILKPFMRGESAEFCAACHKVHLDVPVNKYRWFRGEEAAQFITAIRRRMSPEDNNERQHIHDHESVWLTGGGR